MFVWPLKQTGKVGKLSECMPHELASIFSQTVIFNCRLVWRCRTAMNYFSVGLWFVSGTRSYMTTGSVQCLNKEEAKPNVKQMMALDTGVYCPSDPLQPSGTIKTITSEKCAQQINEMHWKLPRLQPALVNSHIHPNFHQPLPQAFCTGKCFHSQKDTENTWGVQQIPNQGFLHYKGKTTTTKHTLFLIAKLYGLQWCLFLLMTIWLSLVIML